jgi:hypothetical protein
MVIVLARIQPGYSMPRKLRPKHFRKPWSITASCSDVRTELSVLTAMLDTVLDLIADNEISPNVIAFRCLGLYPFAVVLRPR